MATQTALTTDPSRTAAVRAAFARDLNKRFRLVLGAVRGFLETDDELGLGDLKHVVNARGFAFLPDDRRAEAFRDFLAGEVQSKVLDAGRPGNFWANLYLETAYRGAAARGFSELRRDLRSGDAKFFTNRQQDFVRQVLRDPDAVAGLKTQYTRLRDDLKSAAAQMEAAATRAAADAIAQGLKPKAAAAKVNSEVIELGRNKAQMAAHLAVVRAASEGKLDAYELGGVESVGMVAEWITRRGACPRCLDKARRGPYKIKKARGLIPLHPWCRCGWRIVTVSRGRKK